ncbi:hypothetical protein COO60DRAFT_278610 [Scenedesmus sp. NREL 46B-D3]|nr:hypothetical protein COO60DRAFT_278610 [Scenedesmus sp. NREL 46B-D3]
MHSCVPECWTMQKAAALFTQARPRLPSVHAAARRPSAVLRMRLPLLAATRPPLLPVPFETTSRNGSWAQKNAQLRTSSNAGPCVQHHLRPSIRWPAVKKKKHSKPSCTQPRPQLLSMHAVGRRPSAVLRMLLAAGRAPGRQCLPPLLPMRRAGKSSFNQHSEAPGLQTNLTAACPKQCWTRRPPPAPQRRSTSRTFRTCTKAAAPPAAADAQGS